MCRYLQWLIEDQDSHDTQFHTIYAVSLAKSALEIFGAEYGPGRLDSGKLAEITAPNQGTDSLFESPVRERLQIFLQSSDLYDPLQVLELVESSDLWLEKVGMILFLLSQIFEHYGTLNCQTNTGGSDAYLDLFC